MGGEICEVLTAVGQVRKGRYLNKAGGRRNEVNWIKLCFGNRIIQQDNGDVIISAQLFKITAESTPLYIVNLDGQ